MPCEDKPQGATSSSLKEIGPSLEASGGPSGRVSSGENREGSVVRTVPRWAYGLTTVPARKDRLLPQTLSSLRVAGFPEPRLFVDGCDPKLATWYKDTFHLEVTARDPKVNAYMNWVLALAELYGREPQAKMFAMFQDDFVTYPYLREYLESCTYPERGYWNLYTFPINQVICPKDHNNQDHQGWYLSNQLGRGAVALVFNREAVITLLSHQHMVERPLSADRGWKAIDGGIVTALNKAGWKEWVHNPSLVQHMGDHSTLGNKPHKQSTSFKGTNFDARHLRHA